MDMTTELQGLLDRYGLLRRDAALAAGINDTRLASLIGDGELARLARGVYLPSGALDGWHLAAEKREQEFRLRSIAVYTGIGGGSPLAGTVLSHESAAVMHGLPMLKPALGKVHLTNGEMGGGHVRKASIVHASELASGDVVEIDGVLVTSLARTAADVAQMTASGTPLSFARALAVFDAALRAGLDAEALAANLEGRRRCGTRAAKSALGFADGLAESVGESWGRAQMILAGLPIPELQVEHEIDGVVYRVDGEWAGRVVWEFDGLGKYERSRRPGESVADVVIREKKREDALRAIGLIVIRVWWSMLERNEMVPMLMRRLERLGVA